MHVLLLAVILSPAAPAAEGYQEPPEPIRTILDRPSTPSTSLSPDNRWLLELQAPGLRSIEELSAPMVRVAGQRIDPRTNGPSRPWTWSGVAFRTVERHDRARVTRVELPADARVDDLDWSDDSKRLAFTLVTDAGLELWVVEAGAATPKRLTGPVLNAAYGAPCDWLPGDEGMICKVIPADRGPAPQAPVVPAGPRIEENLGRAAPARTYQDLLEDAHSEALFEYYLTSELVVVGLDGSTRPLGPSGLIDEADPSPDGKHVLVHTIHRPFSTTVPAGRFPRTIEVIDRSTGEAVTIEDLPLADDVPIRFGSVRTGLRQVWWRNDAPATLAMVEALDGGDAGREVAWRDAVYTLEAPFHDEPTLLARTAMRFGGISWGTPDMAILSEYWWADRQLRAWRIDPSNPDAEPVLLEERSTQDRYSDPGDPVFEVGPWGRPVLRLSPEGHMYLAGQGHSPEGQYPFLDRFDPRTRETERLWQARDPWLESVVDVLDDDATRFVTRRQSVEDPPDLVLHTRGKKRGVALTDNPDPVPELARLEPRVVRYTRDDGVELSARVYLPPGYDARKDGPLPTVFWAYPNEFKRRSDAAQLTRSGNTFRRPRSSSHLFFLLHGYAVVDDPVIPIIGEGDEQPNDTYVEQLVAGARAAVDFAVGEGFADPDRLIIGGHSYGAFTVANLLAHSDLFAAGIARSGAYNRTLTPFGFQGEERSFWEAEDTYMGMSPFTVADAIDEPILLIHGAMDSNSGTYPMQSERMYEALKGLGATVRWVELPHESHGYQARESVGHVLWEMFRWADTMTGERATADADGAR